MKDLRNVEGITVCTGCFTNEDKLIEHLKLLRVELKKFGFDKRLKYIGSQIRSDKALLEIKKELLPLASMIVVVLILEYFIGPLFTTRITSIITCIICAVVGAIIYGVISYINNLLYNSLGEEYVNQILRKIKIKK